MHQRPHRGAMAQRRRRPAIHRDGYGASRARARPSAHHGAGIYSPESNGLAEPRHSPGPWPRNVNDAELRDAKTILAQLSQLLTVSRRSGALHKLTLECAFESCSAASRPTAQQLKPHVRGPCSRLPAVSTIMSRSSTDTGFRDWSRLKVSSSQESNRSVPRPRSHESRFVKSFIGSVGLISSGATR